MRKLFVTVLLALVATAGQALAQPLGLTHTFKKQPPVAGDLFGRSVAGAGNKALVGVPEDDTGAQEAGAAYFFDTATGALLMTFLNPDPDPGDEFGFTVAMAGNNVLVAAPFEDVNGFFDAGAAYLFDGTTGLLLQTFVDPTPDHDEQFGLALAFVSSNVLVGSPFDGALDEGAAHLFNSSTGALLQTFANPSSSPSVDEFGLAVAGVGSNVLVGAPSDDVVATSSGTAYLFNGSTGSLIFTLNNPSPAISDFFGNAVAAFGSDLIVAARSDNTSATDAGAVYRFSGTTGALLQTYAHPAPATGDQFGSSVATVGTSGLILVGAHLKNVPSDDEGAAYLIDGSTGALVQTFNNPGTPPNVDDNFGFSVAGIGNKVLIGAPNDDTGASNSGSAYLYASANEPPVANAGQDQTLECASPTGTQATLDGSGSSDPDNDPLTYTWSEAGDIIAGPTNSPTSTVTFDVGEHTIELTVDDGNGETDTDVVLITIEDATPPVIALQPAITLWPPNHKYVTLSMSQFVASVSDVCAGDIAVSAVRIASVSSDEPDDAPDGQCTNTDPLHVCFNGDGGTANDILIASDCQSVQLRSERAASGNGRVYTLGLEVSDASGNVATVAFEVSLPHDQDGSVAVDNGPYCTVVSNCGSSSLPKAASGNGEDLSAESAAAGLPEGYALLQNYPNPFNPETEIRFQIPEAGLVTVKVFNSLGEEIRTLAEGNFAAGFHSLRWDGRNHRGEKVQSGMYICRLVTLKFSETKKMILTK